MQPPSIPPPLLLPQDHHTLHTPLIMPPLIQQKFRLDADPTCIPTFDHGLLQQVYVELPCDRYGQQIPLKQFWRLRKPGGLKWEYYCPCTPPADTPGIPARCYEVKKESSRYFGRVYLGCGKTRQRCQWKVRLDLVFSAVAARTPALPNEQEFPDSETFDDTFNNEFAQLMDELRIAGNETTPLPPPSTGIPGSEAGENFNKLFGDLSLSEDELQFLQGHPTLPQVTEEEMAQILSELTLNEGAGLPASSTQANPANMVWNEEEEEWQLPTPIYEEMLAFFAGQDDVRVSLDGSIHFNPEWAAKRDTSEGQSTTAIHDDSSDETSGDTTLVEISPELWGDDMTVDTDITAVKGASQQSKAQLMMYLDLTGEDFPRKGKQKLASLPPDHEMFVDLTQLTCPMLSSTLFTADIDPTYIEWFAGELSGSGTFEDPFELIDFA
ncbi:hypothetical protein C8J55DRAFT_557011 [Lentinula edodes]|uniref:Uncharacterized protein n=1 Tax=Lentinula lateritia TaxID=40482 RepID=A0A9W9AVK5_9AGAR|nr:hypothetical protein C8J55DRAFT_557011 [Lentinula edodes]